MISPEFTPKATLSRFAVLVQNHRMKPGKAGRPPKAAKSYPLRARAIRQEKGMSLDQVAQRAGLGIETVRRYELGERVTRRVLANLDRIAKALEVPFLSLFEDRGLVAQNARERDILEIFRHLQSAQCDQIVTMARALAPRNASETQPARTGS